jgi:mannose-6-phosphate isomerase-like protein (cupin superfamily)
MVEGGEVSEIEMQMHSIPRESMDFRRPVESRIQNILDVDKTASMNRIKPLVCTSDMDTAVMRLDYMAYTREQMSEKTFSMFVIQGKIVLNVNGEQKTIKKGETTVVLRNSIYTINCVSPNGSRIFLSYAL